MAHGRTRFTVCVGLAPRGMVDGPVGGVVTGPCFVSLAQPSPGSGLLGLLSRYPVLPRVLTVPGAS